MLYKRILLKLSGEALMGQGTHGIDPAVAQRLAGEIHAVASQGTQLGLVIGGGNLLRGASLASQGMNRVSGDHMGMLATVMNALAMQDAIEKAGSDCLVMSALSIDQVCEPYSTRQAIRHLEQGRVVIFAAGTGSPVDGVYTADPMKDPEATLYKRISYDEALAQKLGVMDATALVLCSEHNMPLRVFNVFEAGQLGRIVDGQDIGTLVQQENQE
jgi:uridylate kinase